jgi:hypothetical protein
MSGEALFMPCDCGVLESVSSQPAQELNTLSAANKNVTFFMTPPFSHCFRGPLIIGDFGPSVNLLTLGPKSPYSSGTSP